MIFKCVRNGAVQVERYNSMTSLQKFAQSIFPFSENYAYCNDLVRRKNPEFSHPE